PAPVVPVPRDDPALPRNEPDPTASPRRCRRGRGPNMPSERGPLRRYGFAFGAVLCAALLTWLLGTYLEPLPAVLLMAAVLASAWYGGVGPGLLAILLWVVAAILVLPPQPPSGAKGLAGFGIIVLFTTLLGWQSSANRRARAALRLLADAG